MSTGKKKKKARNKSRNPDETTRSKRRTGEQTLSQLKEENTDGLINQRGKHTENRLEKDKDMKCKEKHDTWVSFQLN